MQINTKYHSVSFREGLSPNEKTQTLADKWRQERNFWIATMCLLLWIVLSRFYVLSKHNLALREQVEGLGAAPRPETATGTPAPLDQTGAASTSTAAGATTKKRT